MSPRLDRKTLKAIEATLCDALAGPFNGNAHAFLQSIYKNPLLPTSLRIKAAAKAIGYEKPKLASVKHVGQFGVSYEDRLAALEIELIGPTDEALARSEPAMTTQDFR